MMLQTMVLYHLMFAAFAKTLEEKNKDEINFEHSVSNQETRTLCSRPFMEAISNTLFESIDALT